MPYMVKEVAEMAGVSVRTLHYYDEIGLLQPDDINDLGYRFYSDEDLENLQQIMFFKELDFSLADIKDIMNSPAYDKAQMLKNQKNLLVRKKERLLKIIESIDETINSMERGIEMKKDDMFNSFDMSEIEAQKKKYAEEVKEKYGDTDAYSESNKRTANYGEKEWASISKEQDKIYQRLADLMSSEPGNPEVQQAVGEWRQLITDNFYYCTIEIFRGLGELYVSDKRFTRNIDKYKPGLAEFLSKAIEIYCNKHEN